MRLARIVVLALILTLTPATNVRAQERIPATVTEIVDGDTIKVQLPTGPTLTVRLTGIDTPETKHPSKPVQCFGVEAAVRTAELLPIGSVVDLERDVQQFDRYGRTLAYVWSPDGTTLVNERLVREGYALTLTIPPNVRYAETFANAQQAARDQGAGLWGGCADGPHEATDEAVLIVDEPAGPRSPVSPPATAAPASTPQASSNAPENCHPSYPDFCIPPPPPDLNCTSPLIGGRKNFTVRQPDPHNFDADKDGIGCESRR